MASDVVPAAASLCMSFFVGMVFGNEWRTDAKEMRVADHIQSFLWGNKLTELQKKITLDALE